MTTKLYAKEDVRAHLDLADSLATVEKTYAELARERVLNPPKLTMHLGDDGEWPDRNAFSIDMPAYVDWLDVAGMKWAVATWDLDTEIPISSQILLFDLDTGRFTAVMEGMYVTGVRTALQSVVGLQHLVSDIPSTIGLFGSGFQAGFQVSTIDSLTHVDEFRVYDVDAESARQFTAELNPQTDATVTVADSATEAASQAAVITVTDSKTPVLESEWLDDASFVIALGSYRELTDEAIFAADHVVVDQVDQCLQRGALADAAARGALTEDDIDATIGSVLTGGYSGEIDLDDSTLFVPIGLGALDIALAQRIHNGDTATDISEFSFI
ncbi:MAG: ornithine cyclodeaminase family protein [Halobellus sp.]|uniref:ornithine cyclodeaminase family protein n=1 Tax=Halobellus sp. TaxID=1979212 RepID=UPI0035D52947